MHSKEISEAIELYREAGLLFRENKMIAREATKNQQAEERLRQVGERRSSWIETAAQNAAEMRKLLERIITLGEESDELRRHKVYALAHRNLGLYFSRRFRAFHAPFPEYLDEVAEHLTKALRLGIKRDRKISRTLGAAYYQSGRFKEAVEPLRESIEQDPEDAMARYHLCLAYLSLQEREKARAEYEALKLHPSSADYHLAKMLEPMMESKKMPLDEREREELKRELEGFRRAGG